MLNDDDIAKKMGTLYMAAVVVVQCERDCEDDPGSDKLRDALQEAVEAFDNEGDEFLELIREQLDR